MKLSDLARRVREMQEEFQGYDPDVRILIVDRTSREVVASSEAEAIQMVRQAKGAPRCPGPAAQRGGRGTG